MSRRTTPRRRIVKSALPGGIDATVLVYRCRMRLDDLHDTNNPEVKFCDHCARSVYRVRDAEGVLQLIAADACAWFPDEGYGVEMGVLIKSE